MCYEVSLGSVGDVFNEYDRENLSQSSVPGAHLSKTIFSPPAYARPLDHKRAQSIEAMKVEGSVEIKIEASWGGKDKTEVSVGASGEIQDSHGNYAKGKVKQDIGGEGKVSVSGGHKKEADQ